MIIEILIRSLKSENELKINTNSNEVFFNGNKVVCNSAELSDEILNTIKNWNPNMINNRIVDGESYRIKITNASEDKVYVGKNSFPQNYSQLKTIIKKIANY